jgi:methylmalonyl-CoA carboxyltransferase 12S subunit
MTTENADLARIADGLEAVRQELSRLADRVAALEARSGSVLATGSETTAEGLSEELLLVLSAAVAAYLGKKVPIRAIRLLGSAAWSHQGRATIQASHEQVLSRTGR